MITTNVSEYRYDLGIKITDTTLKTMVKVKYTLNQLMACGANSSFIVDIGCSYFAI